MEADLVYRFTFWHFLIVFQCGSLRFCFVNILEHTALYEC